MPHQNLNNNDSTPSELVHLTADDNSRIKLKSQPSDRFIVLPPANQLAENSISSLSPEEISVAEVYVGQALMYFEQNQWSESIAACQEALSVYPKMGVAYKIWGNSLQRAGKSAEAIGIYAKALQANADMADIYSNLGSIYAKQRKWQRAVEHYQKSIIINPNSATPYRNLARVWDELREYDKSADCFFKAISLQPNLLSAQNHFKLGNNLLAEGNRQQAIACYKSCIDLEPKFLNAYARLADALEQDGQTEIALAYYQKLAQLQTEAELTDRQTKSSQYISELINPAKARASKTPETIHPQRQKSQIIALPESQGNQNLLQLQPAKATIEEQFQQLQQRAVQQPDSASIQFELGQLYFASRQWQPAINCYLQAIKLAPQEAKYHVLLGRAWSQVNNHDQANLAYYQGFSLKPEEVSGKNHFLLGEKLFKQNSPQEAVACYRRAISRKPDLIQAYWRLGEIVAEKKDYKTAIACYRRALKIAPNQSQTYFLLGKALSAQGNWQGALAYYQQAATLEPSHAEIYSNLGESLFKLQRDDEAAKILRKGIARHPQFWQTYYQLGNVLSQQKLWQEAVGAYEKAILYNEQDFSLSHHYLGQAHLELRQWQPAVTAFSKAIELNAALSWSHYGLGSALSELKQWQAAAKALTDSIKLNSDFDWAYHKLGNAKAELQDWDEAVRAYRRALEITPGLPKTEDKLNDVLHKRSTLDLKQVKEYYQGSIEREPESESAYFRALEVSPNNPDIYTKLAELYQSQGNTKHAIAFYKIVLQIQPDNLEIGNKLKKLQSQLIN
jgi:O-antigen biosynthesis protein